MLRLSRSRFRVTQGSAGIAVNRDTAVTRGQACQGILVTQDQGIAVTQDSVALERQDIQDSVLRAVTLDSVQYRDIQDFAEQGQAVTQVTAAPPE